MELGASGGFQIRAFDGSVVRELGGWVRFGGSTKRKFPSREGF